MAFTARMAVVMQREVLGNQTHRGNATQMLINDLVFAQSKSVRTSTIILASFNVLAAFATASSILYDCYWASKRCNPKFKASKFCVSSIHPAETFPLILSIGIVIQGLVFAASQGQGMESLFTEGCDVIAQYMLPALFLVPFIQIVFGLECAFRSLRKASFHPRGKYDVTICCVVILLMLVGTWIPTNIFKQRKTCFASLLWFVSDFGMLSFLMLAILGGLMVISTLTIFFRLSRVNLVDQHQRIAASRMVYYLVLGIMSMALVIPYFASLALRPKGDLKLAMMGTVVVNLSGLMNGLLHLFLRSNLSTSSFGPKDTRHGARDKHEIRLWGPNELAFTNYLTNPVSAPQSPQSPSSNFRSESRTSLMKVEKFGMTSPPFRSPGKTPPFPITPVKAAVPAGTAPALGSPPRSKTHFRKPSYSLFPSEGSKSSNRSNDNVESVYDLTDLEPPPPVIGRRHLRNSSVVSSATVQIGLRLSHAPGTEPEPLPSTTYTSKKLGVPSYGSLLLPIAFGAPASKTQTSPSPNTFNTPSSTLSANKGTLLPTTKYNPLSKQSSPLQVIESVASSPRIQTAELPLRSSPRVVPSPLITVDIPKSSSGEVEESFAQINKDLPPTPGPQLNSMIMALRGSTTQLAPAVYSPSNSSGKKADSPIVNGLPSGPRLPKTPNSAGLWSPSSTGSGSLRFPRSEPGRKTSWI